MAASTTHYLPFTRFTRQVATDAMAVLSTPAAAVHAEDLLKVAKWTEAPDDKQSTFPARDATQTGAKTTFDAYKYCGDYASGYQQAYAGMVAYRFKVPAAAAGVDVVSIAIPTYVDRWLVNGVRVAAYLSDDAAPSEDWTTLREGSGHLSAQLPMLYTEDDPPQRIVAEKDDTLTITFAAPIASEDYLWVVVSLEDYTTTRGFWIEGAALIIGDRALTTFGSAINADAVVTPQPNELEVGTPLIWIGNSDYVEVNMRRSIVVDNAKYGIATGINSFPWADSATETFFTSTAGGLVGYSGTTADTYYGVCLGRSVRIAHGSAYTKMRFGAASVFPLASKEFAARMVIWAGKLTPYNTASDVTLSACRPSPAASGYLQSALWDGSVASADVSLGVSTGYREAIPFAKVGDVALAGRDYSNIDYFDIDFAGLYGTVYLMILVSASGIWAASSGTMATASATFAPGNHIYLS